MFWNSTSKVHNFRAESPSYDLQPRMTMNALYYRTETPHRIEESEPYLNYQHSTFQARNFNNKAGRWLNLTQSQWKMVLKFSGFICILIGCLYQSCTFLSLYLVYPTTVEFNVANENVLDFPAVTLCNGNP